MEIINYHDNFRIRKRYFFLRLRWNVHHVFNQIMSLFEIETDGILLLLPARLSGSFGDEIMTVTFIDAIDEKTPITLYERNLHERPDLFGSKKNVTYLEYKFAPKFHKFKGGVYIIGADNLTPSYGIAVTSFKCKILRYANKYNIPTGILAFSLNKGILKSPLEKDFVKLLPKTQFKLRDPDSYDVANIFLPSDNLEQVADLAFLCPYDKNEDSDYLKWISFRRGESKIIAGICPNSMQADKIGIEKYIQHFISTLEKLHYEKNVAYVFLYHDVRGDINDRDLSEKIYLGLKEKNIDSFFKSDIRNGVELKSYLEYVDFTITGRMHCAISGYSFAKPMFGISYEDKFSGLQKLFGVDVNKSLISYVKLENFYEVLEQFVNNLPQFIASTKNNLPKVIALSQKNFEELNQ